jgi:hypothetical protein
MVAIMVESLFPRRFLLLLLRFVGHDSAFTPNAGNRQERITLSSVSDKQLM